MVEQFISTLSSKNTKNTYRRYAAKFVEWLGDDKLAELEPEDVLTYISWLRDEGYTASSINLMLSAVRELLRWAVLTKRVQPGVYASAQAVKGLKAANALPTVLTKTQVNRLMAAPDITTEAGARDLAFMRLSLATGCRLSELASLNIETLDWDGRRIVVRGKGEKDRVVFFNEDAASALVAYLMMRGAPPEGPLFLNDEGLRVSNRWLQKAVSFYGSQVGIKDLHPHTFRHTFATWFLEATGDLAALQDILGHSDPATTRIYTRLAMGRHERLYREAMENDVSATLESEVTIEQRQPVYARQQPLSAGAEGVRQRP